MIARSLFACTALLAAMACAPMYAASQAGGDHYFARSGSFAAQAHSSGLRVRLLGPGRDIFRSGEALRLNFQTSRDAYVAVVHIDTDGRLEFLYPEGPWDRGYVRGGRSYRLPASSRTGRFHASGRPGIGYVYVIASPVPLDFRAFDRGGWGFQHFGRAVRGDPFYALDLITEDLVGDPYRIPYATDLYTYHVGHQRHPYPTFACYTGAGMYYTHYWYVHYRSCGAVRGLLRGYPYYYYDARYFRGDRRAYQRALRQADTRVHEFKEDPVGRTVRRDTPPGEAERRSEPARQSTPQTRSAPTAGDRTPARPNPETRALPERSPAPATRPTPQSRPAPAARPAPDPRPDARPSPEPQQRPRPRLERRPPPRDDAPAARPAPQRDAAPARRPAARPAPQRGDARARTPARRPAPSRPARGDDEAEAIT